MGIAPGLPVLFVVPILIAALLFLVTALGRRLLKVLRFPAHLLRADERAFLYATLGTGVLQYLPFSMGAFRLLSATNLRLAVAGLTLPLVPDIIYLAGRGRAAFKQLRSGAFSRPAAIWLVTLLPFLGGLFVRGLVVSSIGEDDGYHLMAPKQWLHSGGLDYLPSYIHTNAPMGFEMVYMIGLALGGAAFAKSLHLVAGALCLLGIFLIAKRVGYPSAGMLAVSGFMLPNPLFNVPGLMNAAYVDLAVCWMTTAAILLWCAWSICDDRHLLMCAALCAGFAGSFKFIALSVGGALVVVILIGLRRRGAGVRSLAVSAGIAGSLSFAPVAPWLWRNWKLTGNPLYPMFSSAIPTREWRSAHAKIFESFFRLYNWETTLQVTETQRKEILLAGAALILLPLGVAAFRVKRPLLRDLLIFSIVLASSLLATTGLYARFYLPVVAVTGLVVGCACLERWPHARWLRWSPVIILALALAKWSSWAAKEVGFAFMVTSGLHPQEPGDQFWKAWRYVNEHTPPNSRLLIGAFCPSFQKTSGLAFWVDRTTYNTDAHLQDFIIMDDWPSFLESVAKAKVDFMVVANSASPVSSAVCSDAAFFPEAKNEFPFCRRLANQYGTRVYQTGELGVYKLAVP